MNSLPLKGKASICAEVLPDGSLRTTLSFIGAEPEQSSDQREARLGPIITLRAESPDELWNLLHRLALGTAGARIDSDSLGNKSTLAAPMPAEVKSIKIAEWLASHEPQRPAPRYKRTAPAGLSLDDLDLSTLDLEIPL